MAKKVAAPKKPEVAAPADASKQLVDAIVAVKHLQAFISQNGGLDNALAAVTRVDDLVKLTGSFAQLKQALEIVGKPDEAPAQA